MGKQFNLKDARTIELAQALASGLGKSVTAVIREALEEKAQRRDREIEQKVQEVMKITDRLGELWNPETRHMSSKELMDAIYDENGLPL